MSGTTKILQPEPIERCPFGGTAEEEAAYSLALDSLEKISSVLAEKPLGTAIQVDPEHSYLLMERNFAVELVCVEKVSEEGTIQVTRIMLAEDMDTLNAEEMTALHLAMEDSLNSLEDHLVKFDYDKAIDDLYVSHFLSRSMGM